MENKIDIMGVLNSITADQTIAKAEQIELTLENGTKTKISSELLQYLKGASATDIINFVKLANKNNNKTDHLFLCTTSNDANYEVGHIYFYSGFDGTLSDITPAGSGSGGGSGSVINLKVNFREQNIPANTEFSIPFTWSSINRGYGQVYCIVDGTVNKKIRMQPGTSSWDVSGLSRGNHQLLVYVVDSGNLTSVSWEYTLSIGSLEIVSNFDESRIYALNTDIKIPYTIYNNDDKLLVKLVSSIDNNDETEEEVSQSLILQGLEAGEHKITLKAKTIDIITGEENFSNELIYNILIAQQGVLYVTIDGSSDLSVKEKEKVTLKSKVTYIGASSFTATLSAQKRVVNGSLADWVDDTTVYAEPAVWHNGSNSFIISSLPKGDYKFTVTVSYNSSVSKQIVYTVSVKESDLLYINSIVDESLLLHLSASGKSNSDISKNKWLDTSVSEITSSGGSTTNQPINVVMHDFNYITNGWIPDANGQTRLVIDSGAYVEIDLKPLLKEIGEDGEDGFTFDIEFATKDVLNSNARVLSCFNGQRGFYIDTEYATLSNSNSKTEVIVTEKEIASNIISRYDEDGNPIYLTYTQYTQTGPFQTPFPSETKTRVTFVVERGATVNGKKDYGDYEFASMNIYMNGVLTSTEKISDDLISTAFENGGMKIYLGCDNDLNNKGYAEIYNLRCYKRALSMEEVVVNYISDIEDPVEQSDMIRRNSLKGTISTDLPSLELYFKPDDYMNMTKENKVMGRAIFTNYNGSTENFDKFIRCQWQGTSTLAYAVKNLKFKLYDDYAKKTKFKFDLGNGIKEDTFTLKADYMDSAHMRNTGTANFVSDLGTEQCPAQEFIPACRTAIYGFPVLVYLVITNNEDPQTHELTPTQEELNNRVLLGSYNLNLDKSCTDSLSLYTKSDFRKKIAKISEDDAATFDQEYPNWDCMSFEGSANSDSTAGAFASIEDDSIYSDFELRFEDQGDIEDAGDKTSVGTFSDEGDTVIVSGINSDINGIYEKNTIDNTLIGPKYVLSKTSVDLLNTIDGTYTTNYVYKPDLKLSINVSNGVATVVETAESRIARRYSHLKKFIKWVKDADDETFKKDFEKHCNFSACLDYYLTVFVLLMVDNLGKNVMWNTWGPVSKSKAAANPSKYAYTESEVREYDNYIWYPQFYDMDTCLGLDNSGNMRFDVSEEVEPGIFNTSNSFIWSKFRRVFADKIKERYIELRTYSDEHSTYTEKSLMHYYYENQIQKVSEMNYNKDIRQKYLKHSDYLFMSHGRQYELLQRFISQRLYFLDTVFEVGNDWGKQSTIRVEYGNFANKPVTFKIKTYKPAYVQINFTAAAGKSKKLKVPRNGEIEFSDYVSTATDQEVIIYDAPNIKAIGDVSEYTPKLVEISEMTKLTELTVGTEEHPNPNLTSLSLGNNTYLTKLVMENCTAMNGSINVSNCTNLQYVSTKGSTISYVQFNSNGGGLLEAHFSYATTTINLNNFMLLKSIDFEDITNLVTMHISNCPILTGYIDDDGNIVNGYIYGNILNNWAPTNKNTSINISGYGNLSKFDFLDSCALLHENYGQSNRRISLSGQITYLGESIPTMYSTYKNYFPNLTVKYPNVNNVSSMFAKYNNINSIYSAQIPVVDELTGFVSYVTKYFWTDVKKDKFSDQLENGRRPINCYDQDDQLKVADEIKECLSPFERFTNMDNMFDGDEYIEIIHPETFDNIDVTDASTNMMFYNCKRLKYIEMPKVSAISDYTFFNCVDTTIFIPKETKSFSNYAFSSTIYINGQHQLLLFESDKSAYDKMDGARDCRFNIKRNPITNRPLNESKILCDNIVNKTSKPEELLIKYFDNGIGKLIYDVNSLDGNLINFTTWNQSADDEFANPLNIYEMLYKSMLHFDQTVLTSMAIPAFDVTNLSDTELYDEETNISKLFNLSQATVPARNLQLQKVYILMDTGHTKLTDAMFKDSSVPYVSVQNQITQIGKNAFKDSSLEVFDQYNFIDSKLNYIGDFAFSNTHIGIINIPNTVTYIGERAYEKNDYITQLKYSTAMTMIPIGCFANCNKGSIITSSISGFSSNITEISEYAFDGSVGLLISSSYTTTKEDGSELVDPYKCYWVGTSKEKCQFLDYFTNLQSIGNYAFRNVQNIKTIKLNSKIKYIGASAFLANNKEFGVPTKLIWDLSEYNDYSLTTIENNAFAGREFDWETDIRYSDGSVKTSVLKQTVFIPSSIYKINIDAFSSSSSVIASTSVLRYLITDAENRKADWNEYFAVGQLKTIYNYHGAVEYSDNGSISLYFVLNDKTSIYMRLLNTPTSIFIPESIEYNNTSYSVVEIAEEAFNGMEENLNGIYFDEKSKLQTIGDRLFTVDENGKSQITTLSVENTDLEIPETVSYIGEGTPFKQTSWYAMKSLDDFVYLNDYCLGYSVGRLGLSLSDFENPKQIKNSTTTIYDQAFEGQNLKFISLPSSLKIIGNSAFRNCSNLQYIDFTPCENSLSYIGSNAFENDLSLEKMHYTKKLRHVGSDCTKGCINIIEFTFDEGCNLDIYSKPISPALNQRQVNETITTLKICASMGKFFSSSGVGYGDLCVLSNIKNLVLGSYTTTKLPYADKTNGNGDALYILNLHNVFGDNGVYSGNDIIIYTTSKYFDVPIGDYNSNINLGNVNSNLYDDADLIRIVMGYKEDETHFITAKSDFVNRTSATMYRTLFGNRVSTILAI